VDEAHVSMASWGEDQANLEKVARRRMFKDGEASRQTNWRSGSELLLADKHVPDRVSEPAGEVDLGDLAPRCLPSRFLVRW
jgi:hypothetical protein